MRLEREERIALISAMKAWYRKQIFLSQCTEVGEGLKVGPDPIRVFRSVTGKLIVGKDVILYTPCEFVVTTHIFPESTIEVGDRTRIGANSSLRAAKCVKIGKGCLIAPWVRIFDYNGHPLHPGGGRIGAPTPPDEVAPVIVGDNVWIGENAFIQRGVTIGNDSVVAANSVVARDVPEGTVVMGIPARVALRLADLDRKTELKPNLVQVTNSAGADAQRLF
jgi:acetyltransferase-like isoleucine patch superfamily enzyme